MQHEHKKTRFAGKGYYIALIACLAAVGISGYVFVRTAKHSARETVAAAAITELPAQTAAAATPAPTSAPSRPQETPADRMEDSYEEDVTASVVWPLEGEVTAVFSLDTLAWSETMADWRTHEGLDIAAEAGTAVCATQAGTVTAVYEDDYLGQVVVVSHSGDLATLYANLAAETAVSVGDAVEAGDVLGVVGQTALLETADGPHLHFAVYENGSPTDPMSYLEA